MAFRVRRSFWKLLGGWLFPFKLRLVLGYGGSRAQSIAETLRRLIPSRRFIAWMTSRYSGTIVAGQRFEPEVDKRIVISDVLLMVWTSQSQGSTEATRELDLATELRKDIFPFVERGVPLPSQLVGWHNVDFAPGNPEAEYAKVLANLEEIRKTKEDLWRVKVSPA